jgi:hypothetical protein
MWLKKKISYSKSSSIIRHHGLLVYLLYWITEFLSWLSISHWLRQLPRQISIPRAYNKHFDKPASWWQDTVYIFSFVVGIIVANLAWSANHYIGCFGSLLSAYVLFGAILYHIRVLWFDDLKPGIMDSRRAVGSHRRILFISILNYFLMIYLFPSIYLWDGFLRAIPRAVLMDRSFTIATTLSLPHHTIFMDKILIVMSLFYVVIVIATTASIAYHRKEHAPAP